MRYRLLSLLILLSLLSSFTYANDCVILDKDYILEEVTYRGSDVNAKGYTKYRWNLSGLGIDYTDITGYFYASLYINEMIPGNSLRTSVVLDDGVLINKSTAASINALELLGNQSTVLGGEGTGYKIFNVTEGLRLMSDSYSNYTLVASEAERGGDPTSKYLSGVYNIFYLGAWPTYDTQIRSSTASNNEFPELHVCYSIAGAEITNSSWNATSRYVSGSRTGWNDGEYVNLTSNVLSFTVETNVNTNMSCSIYDLNYTEMAAQNSLYKAATTDTTAHSYTLYDNLSFYDDCVYCAFISSDASLSASSGCLKLNYTDGRAPDIFSISRTPEDITSANLFAADFNAAFNITDYDSDILNASFRYYVNRSGDLDVECINGVCYSSLNYKNFTEKSGDFYNFTLDNNEVYMAASYNLDEKYVEETPHSAYTIASNNGLLKLRFYNISNSSDYDQLEFMANASAGNLDIYYCNETYTTGNPVLSPYCSGITTFSYLEPKNHTHSEFSWHKLYEFAALGFAGDTKITPLSYFIYDADIADWNFYYVENDTGSAEYSGNKGTSYTALPYTFDSHVHQYSSDTDFCFQAIAYDEFFNFNITELECDNLDITQVNPSSPQVFHPIDEIGYNSTTLNINYTSSIPGGDYSEIVYYDIEIADAGGSTAYDLGNNTLNLGYLWDISAAAEGGYRARVTAYDNISRSNTGVSGLFYIDRTDPVCSISNGNAFAGEDIKLTASITDLAIDWFVWNLTGVNESGNLSGSLSVEKEIHIEDNTTKTYSMLVYDTAGQSANCTIDITGIESDEPVIKLVPECPAGLDGFMPLIFLGLITIVLYVTAVVTGAGVVGVVSSLMMFYIGLSSLFCHVFIGALLMILGLISTLGFGYNVSQGNE